MRGLWFVLNRDWQDREDLRIVTMLGHRFIDSRLRGNDGVGTRGMTAAVHPTPLDCGSSPQ